MLEDKKAILESVNSGPCFVTELVKRLPWRTERVIESLERMKEEGLIDFREENEHRRGRPRKMIMITALGKEFLESLKKCQMLLIQVNINDVKNAIYQANLSRRLIEHNVSPYNRFIELNEAARAIQNSS